MFRIQTIECRYVVTKSVYALVLMLIASALVGCESSDNANSVDVSGGGDGSEIANGLSPDNDPTEILGDWTAGCVASFDTNGTVVQHFYITYSIDQKSWTESIDHYSADDSTCTNLLGTAVYAYRIEILNSATAATLNGAFFGNATNIDVIDTAEDSFGDAAVDDLGSALGIWLVKDDRLYSNLLFGSTRPEDLVDRYTFLRL